MILFCSLPSQKSTVHYGASVVHSYEVLQARQTSIMLEEVGLTRWFKTSPLM